MGTGVGVGAKVAVRVGVAVGAMNGVAVGIGTRVAVGLGVAATVGAGTCVAVGSGTGVAVGAGDGNWMVRSGSGVRGVVGSSPQALSAAAIRKIPARTARAGAEAASGHGIVLARLVSCRGRRPSYWKMAYLFALTEGPGGPSYAEHLRCPGGAVRDSFGAHGCIPGPLTVGRLSPPRTGPLWPASASPLRRRPSLPIPPATGLR